MGMISAEVVDEEGVVEGFRGRGWGRVWYVVPELLPRRGVSRDPSSKSMFVISFRSGVIDIETYWK